MLAASFGLTTDEFNFLAIVLGGLVVALVPLYVKTWGTAKRAREVHHEVLSNGGVGNDSPTLKDYAMGAYAEAFRASTTAEEARRGTRDNGVTLQRHIDEGERIKTEILSRIDAVESSVSANITHARDSLLPTDPEAKP